MDFYTASSWRPPTQPIAAQPTLKSKKKKLKLPEPQRLEPLQTIKEDRPLQNAKITSDSTPLHQEILALRAQCATLEAQRNEALQALGDVAPLRKQCATLEAQRNEAFEALDEVVSSQQPQSTPNNQKISELQSQLQALENTKRVLEERCKTFSAWAEQQRLECSKHAAESERHKETCNSLSESLTEFYAKHSKLYAQHKDLEWQLTSLKAGMSTQVPTKVDMSSELKTAQAKTLEAQTRLINAEKTVQTLLGVRTLIGNAPVDLELSNKTRNILKSVIEILNLANQPTAPTTIQACLTQVCSALADLGDEAAAHSTVASGWLAKRDSVLRSIK